MPGESGSPLPPNVKGSPNFTPSRQIVKDGEWSVDGKDIVQKENGRVVRYYGCVVYDMNVDAPPVIDLATCIVTWD